MMGIAHCIPLLSGRVLGEFHLQRVCQVHVPGRNRWQCLELTAGKGVWLTLVSQINLTRTNTIGQYQQSLKHQNEHFTLHGTLMMTHAPASTMTTPFAHSPSAKRSGDFQSPIAISSMLVSEIPTRNLNKSAESAEGERLQKHRGRRPALRVAWNVGRQKQRVPPCCGLQSDNECSPELLTVA